jgi:hypothetical protein
MSAVLYLGTTGSPDSVFTSIPAMLVYPVVTRGLLLAEKCAARLARPRR